ncbi:MAG: hypothetical protein KKD59_09920, partial [Acidobacteria bacterium]|nr:hypothetical protein [Acidobacteriota bacterium]
FTVIEGVIWLEFFNLLEHLCYALSGISFAAGCLSIIRHSTSEQGKNFYPVRAHRIYPSWHHTESARITSSA